MNKFLKYIACAGLLAFGLGLASCNDDEGVTPSDVTDIRSEAGPGKITLRWDTPDDGTIRFIRVTYFDHLLKKNEVRLASVYADSILIPDTRKKYGTYTFKVQPVSPSGDGGKVTSIDAVSEAAPPTYHYGTAELLTLSATDLSSNAPESSEGPIADLLDDNTATFFHTSWSVSIPGPHWLQVNLNKEMYAMKFYYAPRNNANNKPTDFDLMGSNDGENWFLIRNFTKSADGLPVTATDTYTSSNVVSEQPFNAIRIVVKATNTGSVFWTMSEFKTYYVPRTVYDPEAPDAEE